jgi:ADP-heptose:LPS heptosyltransferase
LIARLVYKALLFSAILFSRATTKGTLQRDRVKRVLVIELTKLGDVVSCLRFFPPLKEFVPNAAIVVLVQSRHASLFPLVQEINEVLTSHTPRGVRGLMKSVRQIRRQGFDLVVSASPSLRHGLLVLLSGAKYKFGFLDYSRAKVVHLQSNCVRSLGFKIENFTDYPVRNINERAEALCNALGLQVLDRSPALGFLRSSPGSLVKLNSVRGLSHNTPYIVVHPFASWSYKSWPLENFRGLVHRILDQSSDCVLIICAEGERSPVEPLLEEFHQHPRVAFGIGLPLDHLAAILARARLFIGNDSGPLHLAAAVGTPFVGLFGPTTPELTGPILDTASFAYRKVECSPCDQENCVRKWAPCMTLITVDEGLDKVREILVSGIEPHFSQTASPPNFPQGQSHST